MKGARGTASRTLLAALLAWAAASAKVNFFDASAGAPTLLSQTGIYASLEEKRADTALKFYEINSALWSDGARKHRWIVLPPGRKVTYRDDTDYFGYPDSTIFVKTFLLDSVAGDTLTRRHWETRLLVNKRTAAGLDHWYGFSYRWNTAGTEARLIDMNSGFDTVFFHHPNGPSSVQRYRKWRFPSRTECGMCHWNDEQGLRQTRGVLSFIPPQLKRPLAGSNVDQAQALFTAGVFTGVSPSQDQLRRRFIGVSEAIPAGLSAEARFARIDTMARAYLAANCSGCHGTRQFPVSSAPEEENLDFHRFVPEVELAHVNLGGDLGLANLDSAPNLLYDGGYKYRLSATRAGLNVASGPWSMVLPPTGSTEALLYPGYPAFSQMLYRQLAMRRTPWRDSLALRHRLAAEDPAGWAPWIFKAPWGSRAWRDSLAAHGLSVDTLVAQKVISFNTEGGQMPPRATYEPDTAGLKILGEWVATYRSGPASARWRPSVRAPGPYTANGVLRVPSDWKGRATLTALNGRAWTLASAGVGRYALPPALPPGLYALRVGERSARISILK